jgi:pimeloyl-ACP methyl ester carboxylesterase
MITFSTIQDAPRLQLRRRVNEGRPPVLYIHGATFPSALSVGYRFADGVAWEDSLHGAGFDAWALDFEGFRQIARAVQHVLVATSHTSLSIIAHSWGGIPAARFTTEHGAQVDRLVLFAPVTCRQPAGGGSSQDDRAVGPRSFPAWRTVTVSEQRARFVADTPEGEAGVLAEPMLDRWGPAWLASDPEASMRTPPAVMVPAGPQADIATAWMGTDLYDPALLGGDILFVRGEWDSVSSALDAEAFASRAHRARVRTATIPRSGHLAHLETNRAVLWSTVNDFLPG